jgi:outer membrane protein OmpA-like peptidoglycan-associated protein
VLSSAWDEDGVYRRSLQTRFWYSVAVLFVSFALLPDLALAQSGRDADTADDAQWFLGGYYRHTWVPGAFVSPFFERVPTIRNHGFGITASHHSRTGVTAEFGIGYMPYHFSGAVTERGAEIEGTEYATSKLALVHLTGSLLWPIELHRMLSLEIGLGIDLGAVIGSLRRSEAYRDANGDFHACDKALKPATTGPDLDAMGAAMPYCDPAIDDRGNVVASNPANVKGAQYGIRESRIPPVMMVPMLPHLAIRFAPHERIAIKLEAAFGLAQVWFGASLQVGLGRIRHEAPVPEPVPEVLVAPKPVMGRVLGKLMETATNVPIAHASVKTRRSFSPIETDSQGLFVFDRLDPGLVRFEISHPDYESASCEATVAISGGEAFVHCFLAPKPKEGAISGQIKDEQGNPVAAAHVEVTGQAGALTATAAEGLFAVADVPEGTYLVRVDAEGFMIQLVEVEVRSRETATPQIILLKKPDTVLVTREANELALKQQIGFDTNSAEILPASDGLLRAIADLMLRNRDLTLIEIQGHTDNRGGQKHNQSLSQARAEAVRAWLVGAGVEASRLQARGYGQDQPLQANDTAGNRAKNRRVQFILR